MKSNKITTCLLILIIAALTSCEKVQDDVSDYFPEVKTVSATILQDGTVLVKGKIINKGTTDIAYAGFCMDTLSTPGMLDYQQLSFSINNNEFTAIYSGHGYNAFDHYKRYYFRAWAANDRGYAYGNTIHVDSIQATPVVAPCSFPMNYIKISPGNPNILIYDVSMPVEGLDNWEITVYGNTGTYFFVFPDKPTTKVYTTTANDYLAFPNQAYMHFYSGSLWASSQAGGKIYVNQLGPNQWTIEFCDLPWVDGSSTDEMTGAFECPL